jgi:subtilisin-like proprotein convertase family protein
MCIALASAASASVWGSRMEEYSRNLNRPRPAEPERRPGHAPQPPTNSDFCFCETGSLSGPRMDHTATLLPNGKVLIVGGYDGEFQATAELYDPTTGVFTPTGSMSTPRVYHTATLLPNGKVLVVGGQSDSVYHNSAELYDPVTGTFTLTGNPAGPRDRDTATLLPNGKVLFVSGSFAETYDPATGTFANTTGPPVETRYNHTATLLPNGKVLLAGGFFFVNLTSAELYDPTTGTFTATDSLDAGRFNHTATLLANGKVLIAGGGQLPDQTELDSAELYDPEAGTFSPTGSLNFGRLLHSATLLPNGQVLIAAGATDSGTTELTELYDPDSGTFLTETSLNIPRLFHTATLLANGQVLIAAGADATSELYRPYDGIFDSTDELDAVRTGHTSTLLPNAKVLIAGGFDTGDLASAELFDASTGTFSATDNMDTARGDHTATLLPNGKVLIAGGHPCCSETTYSSAELYDPGLGTFSATDSMDAPRFAHTATLLPNGKVLIAGGFDAEEELQLATAELYDPNTGLFTPTTGNLNVARFAHTATLLPNGKVLIAGGWNVFVGALDSAELYDPDTGTFSETGGLVFARNEHTATLLPNGKVLLAGGANLGDLAEAELYDPKTGTFTATDSMDIGRSDHTATLLANGKVLITGGMSDTDAVESAEIYDPIIHEFEPTGSMFDARRRHTATLLTTGDVLVAGGDNVVDGELGSAELFDLGLAFGESRRPVIATAPATQTQPGTMPLTGTGFRAENVEGSSGTTTSSPTNYPLLHLQRIDNDQTLFVRSSGSWSDTSFTSQTLAGLPAGHYRVTIFTNGIPSLQKLVSFGDPGLRPQISIDDVAVTEGNAGSTLATFTVSLSAPGGEVSVDYATADNTASGGGGTVVNDDPIVIPESGGPAETYPSQIVVAGVNGTIVKVTASIHGLSHSYPADVDILLVGPSGQKLVLMSDAGNGSDVIDTDLVFDDAAPAQLPGAFFESGTYRPTNREDNEGDDAYESPAPAGPYSSQLSAFNGTSPNGTWKLFVRDDFAIDGGTMEGWSLTFVTSDSDYVPASGTLHFPMGTTAQTLSVEVRGDTIFESNETYHVNLSNALLATILDAQGVGTINNDDALQPPANVVATNTSATSVNITWTAAPGAASYRVYRGQNNGSGIVYSFVGATSALILTDATASPNTSYLYKVRSFLSSESADSNVDLATTVVYTDPTPVVNTTKVKVVHFTELLTAVNAVRALAGIATIGFTAPAPSTIVTVRRQHLLDLRFGLDAARASLALSAVTYTDPTITAGVTRIKSAHITNLREGAR